MKLTTFILIVALAQVYAKGFGQKITLNTNHTPIEKVLQSISQQTGYEFLYDTKDLKDRKVTVKLNNASVEEAINEIIKDLPFSYKIVKNNIVLSRIEPSFLDRLAKRWAVIDARGRILDENGLPLEGATILIKGTSRTTKTDNKGEFVISNVPDDGVLVIRYVGYKALEIPLKGAVMPLDIKLNQVSGELEEVAVTGSTGYQVLDKNHPGSFDVVDNKLLNRRVSSDILSRIENLTPGVSFNNENDGLLIRGRSSIFSNVSPLIVVDNFPYDGNIGELNPNDIESVTVLKDAAAASIWGARAGNGVIVITTKKGRTVAPIVELNTNITIKPKPDLHSVSQMSSTEFIDFEKNLFNLGYYDGTLSDTWTHPAVTPVVEILQKAKIGQITQTQADEQLDLLRKEDFRSDIEKYFYRTSIAQQHALNVSGNSGKVNYYMSAGYDNTSSNLVGEKNDRFTLRTRNSFQVTSKLQINAAVNISKTRSSSGDNAGINAKLGGHNIYPYADIVDNNGNALALNRDFLTSFIDTLYQGKLLDWKYRPYEELNRTERKNSAVDYVLNTGINYQVLKNLNTQFLFQNESRNMVNGTTYLEESYYSRNLINSFYQPGAVNNFPIPKGGIRNEGLDRISSNQGRFQVNYEGRWKDKHSLSVLAGSEIKEVITRSSSSSIYGYRENRSMVVPNINYDIYYPQSYNQNITNTISNGASVGKFTDRFLSSFVSGIYVFDDRISIQGSVRQDAANLFGVNTNQRGIPLWSASGGWKISNENFYNIPWLPLLRLRVSHGSTGNYSRQASAYTTVSFSTALTTNIPQAKLVNPPNDDLRWEKVTITNLGLDFGTKNSRITGTLEYYTKDISDLMANSPADPTLGLSIGSSSSFYGNVANMKGNGVELRLNSININRQFKWETNILYSTAFSKITKYLMPPPTGQTAVSSAISPVVGKPVYSLYSYSWGGLDDQGDPTGFLGNNRSKDYSKILSSTKLDSLIYHGSVQPTIFGAVRNTFSWKGFDLSFNISYKFGHYFRRPSVDYSNHAANWSGHGDYSKRWMKPGDENLTDIPAFKYPLDGSRDQFYRMSSVLVEKADHIRFDDLQFTYSIPSIIARKIPIKSLQVYLYMSNLGLLWTANEQGLDPATFNAPRAATNVAFGTKLTF